MPKDEAFNRSRIAAARARLGEGGFATTWQADRAKPLDEAIAFALGRHRDRP